jgi:hypothetical protein
MCFVYLSDTPSSAPADADAETGKSLQATLPTSQQDHSSKVEIVLSDSDEIIDTKLYEGKRRRKDESSSHRRKLPLLESRRAVDKPPANDLVILDDEEQVCLGTLHASSMKREEPTTCVETSATSDVVSNPVGSVPTSNSDPSRTTSQQTKALERAKASLDALFC